jgi:hypothetical protein
MYRIFPTAMWISATQLYVYGQAYSNPCGTGPVSDSLDETRQMFHIFRSITDDLRLYRFFRGRDIFAGFS